MGIPRRVVFSPQTLAVFHSLSPGTWRHGYELAKQTGLKSGTLYPILIRLAERGLVETAWEHDVPRGRPPRHLYRLSLDGAELVAALRRSAAQEAEANGFTARPALGTAGE